MKRGAEEEAGAPQKQLRLNSKQMFSAPSNDELQLLQVSDQADNLATTDLLRLQVNTKHIYYCHPLDFVFRGLYYMIAHVYI